DLHGYIGPKDYRSLKAISPMLTDVIEYGLITFFAKGVFVLLDYLYQFVGNWGWAIILLTIIVRIVLYPLSYKGMVSMQKLKELAPKMKELQEKYKGEPQKLQAHMMQLYKKHGANPLGGCLPLILQIPVFFAIYRVLYNAVELKSSEWILWIHDLSIMDPYFILPLLMGASMYWHQSVTPNTMTDPMQAKIFKLLPLLFTIFLITFPAGLVLYWTTNNILSVLQQLIINKVLENKKRAHAQNIKE
ncbi:membrane protein insertase YidC, partial [Helicobacter pylori]